MSSHRLQSGDTKDLHSMACGQIVADKTKQCGTSMVEILVTLFVIAIGLMGLFALQIQSLKLNQDGYMRTIATIQTYSMLDRIRANRTSVSSLDYHDGSGIPSDPGCTTCNPAQIAQQDIREWNQVNALMLPSGAGSISQSGNNFTITIRWDERRTGATGEGCSDDSDLDLTCLVTNADI